MWQGHGMSTDGLRLLLLVTEEGVGALFYLSHHKNTILQCWAWNPGPALYSGATPPASHWQNLSKCLPLSSTPS